MGQTYMAPYLLKEVAFCLLLAAALVGFTGGSVLVWKAAARLVSGIRRASRPAWESLSAGLERRRAGVWIRQAFAPISRRCPSPITEAGSGRVGWSSKTAPSGLLPLFVMYCADDARRRPAPTTEFVTVKTGRNST